MKRPSTIACKPKEEWHSNPGYKIERKEDHELNNLAEAERRVD